MTFKNWLETAGEPTTAFVGWTGVSRDRAIYQMVTRYLTDPKTKGYDANLARNWPGQVDQIDPQRNFLEEKKRYDVVVLCWINASQSGGNAHQWQIRLQTTGAKHIVVVGSGTEVSGQFLGSIPGYQAMRLNAETTVYHHWNTAQ